MPLVDGEPKMSKDFRATYAMLLNVWLGLPATEVLAGRFPWLELLKS